MKQPRDMTGLGTDENAAYEANVGPTREGPRRQRKPSARERLYLHWNPLAPNHSEMYGLLLEVERAAAYKAMMSCARMLNEVQPLDDEGSTKIGTSYFEGVSDELEACQSTIRSEARKLKAKVRG
jgi:hypothetical protein